MFDDLIPKAGEAQQGATSFADLIPAAPQMEGPLRYPAMAASALAKGVLTGAGALGDLQGLVQNAVNPYADAVARMMGIRPQLKLSDLIVNNGQPAQFPAMRPPVMGSANLTQAGRELGAVDRPDLQPQTTPERYMSAGLEGVGGMMPYALAGPGGAIANAIRGTVQGSAAGLGGQAGADLFPSHPDLARAIGSIAGLTASSPAISLAERGINAARGVGTPTLEAYKALGIEPQLAGDVSGNKTLQSAQATLAKTPFGAGTIHAASERAVDQWGNALENTATALGNSRTLQGVGDELQGASKNWLSQWKNASQQAWGEVDKQIPANTQVPVTNYAQTLTAVQNSMPGAPATAKTLQSDLPHKLLDNLFEDTKTGPLTWQDLKGIRTRVGEMISDPRLVGDTSYADLKRIYGALSTDMGAAVASKGPQAVDAFNQAVDVTKNGHGFVENVLSRILKGNQIAPEKAASTVLNTAPNGGTMIEAIRQEMPKAADELAAYKLRDMGLANPGAQNATGAQMSPGTFLTDLNKLSPEARDALFSSVSQRLGNLATVGDSMKQTQKFLNTSNTGVHSWWSHMLGGATGGFAAGGVPGAAYGALGLPLTEWLAAKGIASPAVAKFLGAQGANMPGWQLRLLGLNPELNQNAPGALAPVQ